MTITVGFHFDRELVAALAAKRPAAPPAPSAVAARAEVDAALAATDSREPDSPSVTREDLQIPVADGRIAARWYRRRESAPGSAVVYAHGGGMFAGSVELYDRLLARYVEESGVSFLAVDYRLAPAVRGSTPAEDLFATLMYVRQHAPAEGIDPGRIALAGDSAGGGIAAGAAIIARDHGVPLAAQILLYPMLDHRSVPGHHHDSALHAVATWSTALNALGWDALLGEGHPTQDPGAYASPARLADASDLAPAFIDVGELDLFRDECVAYASALWRAGVSTELVVRPGCPHGYDRINLDADVARRSWDDRIRVIRSL